MAGLSLDKSSQVLIIYCCVTNYPTTYWLKTASIYYHIVKVVRNLGMV